MRFARIALAVGLVTTGVVTGGSALTSRALADTTEILLPTGQRIHPAGGVVQVGRGAQDLVVTPDGSAVVVANSGRGVQGYSVVDVTDLDHPVELDRIDADPNWVGMAFLGDTLYASGGESNRLQVFHWKGTGEDPPLVAGAPISLFPTDQVPADGAFGLDIMRDVTGPGPVPAAPLPACIFPAGVTPSPDGTKLYVACQESGTVAVVDVAGGKLDSLVPVGGLPYGVAVTPDGSKVFVSDWSESRLVELHATAGLLVPAGEVEVGRHPSAMAIDGEGTLYVANGNDDTVSVLRTSGSAAVVTHTIPLAPYEGAPNSSVPSDVTLSPDGETLFVTLAGNNAVAVVETADPPNGPDDLEYIPTGWFPTAVATSANGSQLYVASARGLGTGPNDQPGDAGSTTQVFGTLQVVGAGTNPEFTQLVRSDNFFDVDRLADIPGDSALYDASEGRSPKIDHVLFVVRENKTFDQVLGDLDVEGVAAEPKLVRYGEANTPNTHAIAREWVIADQFRAPVSESFTGHMWLNFAQLSDYGARVWTTEERNTAIGITDASLPGEGSLLARAAEAGRSYRIYGWDGLQVSTRPENLANFAAQTNLAYPTGLQYYTRDVDRIEPLLADIRTGNLAEFSYIWIPNDHTYDAQPGAFTPQAMVADNDLAVGQIVETLSTSDYWEHSAVFFVEDDPQSGRDHVDSHRTVFLAASPWIERGQVNHERYDFSSLHRTIELLLGLRPTSQYEDKAARPLTELFRTTGEEPDTTPYAAIQPGTDMNTLNPPLDALDPLLRPLAELATTVDRSIVDQDEEKVRKILDGMYRQGMWEYGPGLAPEPTPAVLEAERTASTVEEEEEAAEEAAEEPEEEDVVLGKPIKRASSWQPSRPEVAVALLATGGGVILLAGVPRRRRGGESR